jgi:hypothetical protein
VQPVSTEEVSKIMRLLVGDSSCKHVQFAVRSGGHTTWANSNNIDNGVTIDLGLLNQTKLQPYSLALCGIKCMRHLIHSVLRLPEAELVQSASLGF